MTSEVVLRDVTEADLHILFEHQRDPDANQMAGFTPRDREAFMAHWAKILMNKTITKKTVLAGKHVAGYAVCFEQGGKSLVGYWIGREFWGKGIATQALAQLLDHVARRPLYAYVAKHNVASIRVLQKCGFAVCGEEKRSLGERAAYIEEFLMKLAPRPR